MLKDCNDKIVGILKPDDNETFRLKYKHNLVYRKYRNITSDNPQEMIGYICSQELHYYRYLKNAAFCFE